MHTKNETVRRIGARCHRVGADDDQRVGIFCILVVTLNVARQIGQVCCAFAMGEVAAMSLYHARWFGDGRLAAAVQNACD